MTYNAGSRLVTSVEGAVVSTYTFDANGNQTAVNAGGARTTYAYDYENRMRTAIDPGGARSTLAYWADGTRRFLEVGGTRTTFVWDGSDYLQSRTPSEVTTFSTVDAQILDSETGGSESLLVPDPLGSVVKVLDASGNEVYDAAYWPYGEIRDSVGVNDTSWGYVGTRGYHFDTSRRLYVRARVLDSVTGRWYSVDPLWPDQKPYKYVDAPNRYYDFSGRIPTRPWNDPPDFDAARNKWCATTKRIIAEDALSEFRDQVNQCVESANHSCKQFNLKGLNCMMNMACNPNAMKQSCEPCPPGSDACVSIRCGANPPTVTWCKETMKGGGCNPFASGVPVSVLLGHEMLHCCGGYNHGNGSNEETCHSVVSCCILKYIGLVPPGVRCGNR